MRRFDIEDSDISQITKESNMGELISYNDKDLKNEHSNKIMFVKTTKGDFVLKFYLNTPAKDVVREYLINRNLIGLGFPTPRMYLRLPSPIIYKNSPVAFFDMLDGKILSYESINTGDMKAILSLANLLKDQLEVIDKKTRSLLSKSFYKSFRHRYSFRDALRMPYIGSKHRKIMIYALKSLRKYKEERCLVHRNISLTNIISHSKRYYILDLSHIDLDYSVSMYAGLLSNMITDGAGKGVLYDAMKIMDSFMSGRKEHKVFLLIAIIDLIKELQKIRRGFEIFCKCCERFGCAQMRKITGMKADDFNREISRISEIISEFSQSL